MSAEISQADLLREHIEQKFNENYDYSKSSYKKKDRIAFCEKHPELNLTESKVRKHFDKILDEVAKLKGKTPDQIGKKIPRVNPRMVQAQSDMNATIEGVPQAAQANLVGAPQIAQPQVGPGQGQQQPNQQQQPYVNPNMSVESVGALVQGGMAGIKAILPDLELLSDEERLAAGQILLPPMQRIQDERIQLYVLPLLGLFGIIGPKIGKAINKRKERKAREAREKDEEERKQKETQDGFTSE